MLVEELVKVIESHRKWIRGESDGCRADLRGADLRGADLRGADLRDTDLRDTNLRRADLRRADLRGADLRGAKQKIASIKGSRHQLIAIDDDVRIGCQRLKLSDWMDQYREIGKKAEYSESEIEEYGIYLQAVAKILEIKR